MFVNCRGWWRAAKRRWEFHSSINPTTLNDADIGKVIISGKFPCGKSFFNYFIGYKNDEVITPLCIMLPKVSGYIEILTEILPCLF